MDDGRTLEYLGQIARERALARAAPTINPDEDSALRMRKRANALRNRSKHMRVVRWSRHLSRSYPAALTGSAQPGFVAQSAPTDEGHAERA